MAINLNKKEKAPFEAMKKLCDAVLDGEDKVYLTRAEGIRLKETFGFDIKNNLTSQKDRFVKGLHEKKNKNFTLYLKHARDGYGYFKFDFQLETIAKKNKRKAAAAIKKEDAAINKIVANSKQNKTLKL